MFMFTLMSYFLILGMFRYQSMLDAGVLHFSNTFTTHDEAIRLEKSDEGPIGFGF